MDFVQIRDLPNLIPDRNINHSLMNSNTQTLQGCQFLSSTRSPCRNKGAEHFPGKGLFDPESASGIPEGFPLRGEVAVTGGDAWMLVMRDGDGELGEGMRNWILDGSI